VYDEHTGGRNAYLNTAQDFGRSYRTMNQPFEGTFPLYDFPRDPPSSNYPSTIYNKGAAVLVMLRAIMGDDAFFRGLRSYGQTYAYGNADTQNFRSVMETGYGKSLGWFFDEWVYAAGYPDYIVQKVVDDTPGPFRFRILQQQDTTKYPLFRMPIDVLILLNGGDTARFTVQNDAVAMQEFSFPGIRSDSVKTFLIDPLGLILKKISYRIVNVKQPELLPEQGFHLEQNFPNPMNPSSGERSTLPVSVSIPQHIRFRLYDSLGRNVLTVADREFSQGQHFLQLDGSGLSRGIYTLRAMSGFYSESRRIVVAR